MTIEEHIENLKAIASDMPSDKCSDWIKSLMAGVKALEQEPCGDCISREAVSKLLNDGWWKGIYPREAIMALPSVTPQPKMGRWNKSMDDYYYSYFYTCSCCGGRIAKNGFGDDLFSPYCPECGANMQEVEE